MKKKLMAVALATIIAVMAVAGASLAWLTDTTDSVKNTFTYGNIDIELAETKGTISGAVREFGKVVPGDTIEKDPTVTVKANSENCYVYVKVENNVVLNNNVIVTLNIETNWELIGQTKNSDGSVVSLYKYNTMIASQTIDNKLDPVFETVTFGDFDSDDVATLDAITDDIVVTAYAHQADNTTSGAADVAARAWASVNVLP